MKINMKAIKTILAVCLLSLATAASAQKTYVHITMTDGTKYELASDKIQTMTMDTNDPNATTGKASVTVEGAGITECGWVQLWAGGPKFATMNLGETTVTGNTKTYTWTESGSDTDAATVNWGSAWKVPTETEMNELYKAAGGGGSNYISCTYTKYESTGVYGFLFKGTTEGYADNSLFLPAQVGDSYYGYAYYWSGTGADGYGRYLDLFYNGGHWDSGWSTYTASGNYLVRPVLK